MYWNFLLASVLVSGTQAFVPVTIKWDNLGAKRFFLAAPPLPNGVPRIPQRLKIWDKLGTTSLTENPYFILNSDKTIEWGPTGFCVEAIGDEIGVSACTGNPKQLWNVLPSGNGRNNRIQLSGSDKCIDVKRNKDDLNGAPIVLQECDSKVTESWMVEGLAEEPAPVHTQGLAPFDAARAGLFMVLAMLGAFSLSAWLRHWYGAFGAVPASDGDAPLNVNHGGIALSTPDMMVPAAMAVSPINVEDKGAQKDYDVKYATNITRRNMLAACLSAPVLLNQPAEASVFPTALGITIVSDERAAEMGLRRGVLVFKVQMGAEKAGLQGYSNSGRLGDVILEVGGKSVNNNQELLKALENFSVGQDVELIVARLEEIDGSMVEIEKKIKVKAVLASSAKRAV